MKVILLAAGQGTRLRPLTDHCPKCMVKVKGRSLIERQLETMRTCGIKEQDIAIVAGYRSDVLKEALKDTEVRIIVNEKFETTNMVCSLMCAEALLQSERDILVSYGDIVYGQEVLQKLLNAESDASVVVDDDWYEYWSQRCENPLDDAETLMFDENDYLTEIGQKTTDLNKVQSQYIGLMRFKEGGLKAVLETAAAAKKRTEQGQPLWRTDRSYEAMYMTDLLQGLIEEQHPIKALHIHRDWFEIDDCEDLKLVEQQIE